MGSLLLAAGEPGMRHSLPHSRIMIHQPSGGAQVKIAFIAFRMPIKITIFVLSLKGSSNRYSNSRRRNYTYEKEFN